MHCQLLRRSVRGHILLQLIPLVCDNIPCGMGSQYGTVVGNESASKWPWALGLGPKQASAEITAKKSAAEHFGHFLSKNDRKSLKIWPGRHVQNLGVAFFLEKNAGGSLPRSTWVFCPAKSRMACMAWLLGKDQSWQNMVLVLIGLHMAPNGVLTGSLSRKFRGGSPDGHQIQPSCQKLIEIFRELGPVGSGFCGFSGFFAE